MRAAGGYSGGMSVSANAMTCSSDPSSAGECRGRMVRLLAALAPEEGYNLSALPGVRFLRSNRPLARTPVLYDPGIVIVCQGRKRGYLGGMLYQYDAQHCLAVAVPVPFTMETDASAEEPLLAIYMRLDFTVLAGLLLELGEAGGAAPCSMVSTPMDEALADTVLRLLQALGDAREARILGPSLVREIYYRVLSGAQGAALRTALAQRGPFGRVAQAIRKIHADHARPLRVADLAHAASMSVPSFHVHFRDVTGMAPVQYLKSIRLHQARLLMVRARMGAAAASAAVGYESPSQFSREFKRLFGLPPAREAERLRHAYALPAPTLPNDYVSSH